MTEGITQPPYQFTVAVQEVEYLPLVATLLMVLSSSSMADKFPADPGRIQTRAVGSGLEVNVTPKVKSSPTLGSPPLRISKSSSSGGADVESQGCYSGEHCQTIFS